MNYNGTSTTSSSNSIITSSMNANNSFRNAYNKNKKQSNRRRGNRSRKIQPKDEYEYGLSPISSATHSDSNMRSNIKIFNNEKRRLLYHTRYVKDLTNSFEYGNDDSHKTFNTDTCTGNSKKDGMEKQSLWRSWSERRDNCDEVDLKNCELRKIAGIRYAVPKIDPGKKGRKLNNPLLLVVARNLILDKVDQLICIERLETAEFN